MLGKFALKPFALVLAVYWSLQALLCLTPELGHRAEGHNVEQPSAISEQHHQHSSVAIQAEADLGYERSMDSDEADSDHHQDSGGDCERHCASLSQTVVATAPTVFVQVTGDVTFVTAPVADLVSIHSLARKVDAFEVGLPPPDVLVLQSALRI